jgi:hypothetical protein
MFEAARFRGNRKLHAIVMLRADVPMAIPGAGHVSFGSVSSISGRVGSA